MNYFGIGFGVLALGAVGFIDYANQAAIAGSAPGSYPASAYVASFGARLEDPCSGATTAGAFLPEAPEGWTRSAWPSEDAASDTGAVPAGWIYRRGDAAIAMRAEYLPSGAACGKAGWLSGGAVADLAKAAKRAGEGWAVIGGTAYRELPAGSLEDQAQSAGLGTAYRAVETLIGFEDMVQLTALGTASDDALRGLLRAVDYDGLNGLLRAPLPLMGSDAPHIAAGVEAKAADVLLALQAGVILADGGADLGAVAAARIGVLKAGNTQRGGIALEGGMPEDSTDTEAFQKAGTEPAAASEPRSEPKRLTLSGGKSCLEGSASRLCRD